MNERLLQLVGLEEDRFIAGFHQQVQKEREKAWHDRHIKHKSFKEGDLVLLYDNKFSKFPGKFQMHWLGPYQVKHVTNGEVFPTLVNGIILKIYEDRPECRSKDRSADARAVERAIALKTVYPCTLQEK